MLCGRKEAVLFFCVGYCDQYFCITMRTEATSYAIAQPLPRNFIHRFDMVVRRFESTVPSLIFPLLSISTCDKPGLDLTNFDSLQARIYHKYHV